MLSKADEKNNSNNNTSSDDGSIALLDELEEEDGEEASSLGTSYDYEDDDDDDDDDEEEENDIKNGSGHRGQRRRRRQQEGDENNKDQEEDDIARTETRAMRSLKCIVLSTFFLSMIAVALAVYFYTTNAQTAQFRADFHVHALQVMDVMQERLWQTLDAMDALTVGMVAMANYTNQTWPFVTMPDSYFALAAAKVLGVTQATRICTFPYVDAHQRVAWQNYTASAHSQEWIGASLALQRQQQQALLQNGYDYDHENGNWNVIFNNQEFEKPHPGVNGTESPGECSAVVVAMHVRTFVDIALCFLACRFPKLVTLSTFLSRSLIAYYFFLTQTGPYLPMWQVFPVRPGRSIYNW
jgi:hypothetical protein